MENYDESKTLEFLKELIKKIHAERFITVDGPDFGECCYNVCKKDGKWYSVFYERMDSYVEEFDSLKDLCFGLARCLDRERYVVYLDAITKYFSTDIEEKDTKKRILKDDVNHSDEK